MGKQSGGLGYAEPDEVVCVETGGMEGGGGHVIRFIPRSLVYIIYTVHNYSFYTLQNVNKI